jgi:hypothetical protein
MSKKLFQILLILIILLAASCAEQGGPKEGELVYNISYLQSEKQNPLVALLPQTVVIKFKNDKTVALVQGFFGTFQLRFITVPHKGKSYTVLRILDKKYVAEAPIDSVSAGYPDLNDIKVAKHPEDTITLAGLLSYEADVVCKAMSDSIIKVYYTYDINIKDPNSNTPFKDIDGVLTKFQTKVAGIDMVFELGEFNQVKVNDSEFEVPKDFKKITKKELNDLLISFQQ